MGFTGLSITVEYRRHPLSGRPDVREVPVGLTVRGIVETVSEGVAFDVELVRRDPAGVPHAWPVRPEMFDKVRPTPGTVVRVRPRVRAGAVPLIAGWLSSATGLSVLASQVLVGLALSAVSLLASRMLMGAQVASSDRLADKENPTINGLQNSYAVRGQPVPLPLGRSRMAPVRVATGYSDLVGQKVFRRERMVIGPGPVALHDLKIGETPIHQFDGVKIQFRNVDETETLANYPNLSKVSYEFLDDGDVMTLYRNTIFEDTDGARLDEGVAEIRNTPENTEAANVQIYFAGLVKIDSDNNKVPRSRKIGVYYRPASGGDWVTHSENTYTGETTSTLRFGERIEFPSASAWAIKVVRLSEDDDRTNVSDDSYLEAIQSEIQGDMPSPSGVAEIALRVKATEQLSGSLDPINAVVQQMAPVWDGAAFGAPEPIRHPADIYVHLLRAAYRRDGLPKKKIDLDGIKAWKDTWPKWRCDMVVASDKQLGDLVREVLATGLAIPAQIDGQHTLIHDQSDQPAVQVFTPRNTANFSAQWQAPPEVHAFRLVFPSEKASWTDDELVIYANGYDEDTATEIEVLEPPGLALARTDGIKRLAQWGYYHLAQVKTRTTTVSFTCDLDHITCNRGDPVLFLSDALLNTMATGRVLSVDTWPLGGLQIALDDAPAALDGVTAHLMVRSSAGVIQYVTATFNGYYWITEDGSGVRVQPAGSFDAADIAVGDLAVVYEYETEPQKWLVTEIAPDFGERARVTLTEATTVPLDDMERDLPEYDPRVLTVSEITAASYDIDYDGATMYVSLRWFTLYPASSQRFKVVLEDSAGAVLDRREVSEPFARIPVQSTFAETMTATIKAWQPTGRWGGAYSVTVSTADQYGPPDPTEDFEAAVMGEVIVLTWAKAASNVDYHVIRYTPETTGATWSTAVPVVNIARGEQVVVPAQNGTYLIKPMTVQGTPATTAMAVIVNSVNVSLNAVETLALSPDFNGSGDNGLAVVGDVLMFASDGNVYGIDNLYDIDNLFTWGREALTGTFTLDDIVDLGVVDTVRIAAAFDVYGYFASYNIFDVTNIFNAENLFGDADGEWTIELQISTTADDPTGTPTWSDWTALVIGDYRARGFRFRIVFEVYDIQVIVEVADLDITVDMATRIEKGADIAVPFFGATVTFDPPFREVPAIVVDAQGLPAGGRAVKSAVSASGFTLNFIDSGGSSTSGTADYTAVGYGTEGS